MWPLFSSAFVGDGSFRNGSWWNNYDKALYFLELHTFQSYKEFDDSEPISRFPTISPVSPNTFRCVGFKPSMTDGTLRIKSLICSKNVYQNYALERTFQREGPRKWRQSYGSYINTYCSQKLTNISQNNPKINCCMPRIIARKLNQLFVHLIGHWMLNPNWKNLKELDDLDGSPRKSWFPLVLS